MKRFFISVCVTLCMGGVSNYASAQQKVGFEGFIEFFEIFMEECENSYRGRQENRSELFKQAMQEINGSENVIEEIDEVAEQAHGLLTTMLELAKQRDMEAAWELYQEENNNFTILSYLSNDVLLYVFHVKVMSTIIFNALPEQEAHEATGEVVSLLNSILDGRYSLDKESVDMDVYIKVKNVLIDVYINTERIEDALKMADEILDLLADKGEEYNMERLAAMDVKVLFMLYIFGEEQTEENSEEVKSNIKQVIELCESMLGSDKYDEDDKRDLTDMLNFYKNLSSEQ